MHLRSISLLTCLLLFGCVGQDSVKFADDDSALINEYNKKYSDYVVSTTKVPDNNFQIIKVNGAKLTLWNQGDSSLSLSLGERNQVKSNSIFRTSSRYYIQNKSSGRRASAESVFSKGDFRTNELQPQIRLAYDSLTKQILIVEDHSWSVHRLILFGIEKNRYSLRYLSIPQRRSYSPIRHYKILAFKGGSIFLEQDGHIYSFPVEYLNELENLAYPIG